MISHRRLFAFLISAIMSGAQSACDLSCYHDGVCTEGEANFSEHPTKSNGDIFDFLAASSKDGMHCACHPGYTGLQCEYKYEDCADYDHKCYNGGKCILGLNDVYGNEQLFCDCSGATDDNGVKYVGKYCEIAQTVTCDEQGEVFCVNGGWCKSDYEKYPRRPCHCGPDHEGPHCEFEKGAVPECTLSCRNGGGCRRGIKENIPGEEFLYDYWMKNMSYQYCECPKNFYGTFCEVEVDSDKCGEHHCFHGGECVTVTEGSEYKQHCDCTRAHTKEISYGGKFCQYESENFCDHEQTVNGKLFCVNGGQCHQEGSHLGCICPSGFHGPICEYRDADLEEEEEMEKEEEEEKCNLVCKNGGQCRKGIKDASWIEKFGPELSYLNVTHSNDFEHCVCAEGFLGLQCEHEIELCSSGQHVCLHGSKCVSDGLSCDCEAGSSQVKKLAGKFCQHQSTEICTKDGADMLANSKFAFCVNGGVCVYTEDRTTAACNCTEDFYGPHCELSRLYEDGSTLHENEDAVYNSKTGDTTTTLYGIEKTQNVPLPSAVDVHPTEESSTSLELFAAFVAGAVVLTIGIALFVCRRNRFNKARMIEAAVRHADISHEELVPKEGVRLEKSHHYGDFLASPDTSFIDIPDMGHDQVRPTSSYHDFVFENVEIL